MAYSHTSLQADSYFQVYVNSSRLFVIMMMAILVACQLVLAEGNCPAGQEPGFGGVGCIPKVEGGKCVPGTPGCGSSAVASGTASDIKIEGIGSLYTSGLQTFTSKEGEDAEIDFDMLRPEIEGLKKALATCSIKQNDCDALCKGKILDDESLCYTNCGLNMLAVRSDYDVCVSKFGSIVKSSLGQIAWVYGSNMCGNQAQLEKQHLAENGRCVASCPKDDKGVLNPTCNYKCFVKMAKDDNVYTVCSEITSAQKAQEYFREYLKLIEGPSAVAGLGQTGTTPSGTGGGVVPSFHPLIDFSSHFEPMHMSGYQLSLINSGVQTYNSECQGKAKTVTCKGKADSLLAASQSAFQTQAIAIADKPQASGLWVASQDVEWMGPEVVDLANLHMEDGDQVSAAVIAQHVLSQQIEDEYQSNQELFQSIVDADLKKSIQAGREYNRKLEEMAKLRDREEMMNSATYIAASYDLERFATDLDAAALDIFRVQKAIALSDFETASTVFRLLTGGLSEPMILPAQAMQRKGQE